jgi:hypothetical protein
MKRRREQPVSATVLALWRERFTALRARLLETPNAGDAWFWKVQCHIIQYLLERHGGGEMKMSANSAKQIAPARSLQVSSVATLEVKPSNSFTDPSGIGKPPRVSGQIRPILSNIVQVNQRRYQLLQLLREEMIDALRQEREQIREMMSGYREEQLKRNSTRKFVAAHDALEKLGISASRIPHFSDREIQDVLDKIIAMDSPNPESKDVSEEKGSDKPAN